MAYIKGEDINLGIARETVRGTPEAPATFIAGRTPTGVRLVVDKTPIRETRGGGMSSQGSVPVMKRAEGDLEFNVKNGSIGYLLLSLLGQVNSAANGDAYSHVFTILTGNPQHPTLTLALSQLGMQDYRYKKAIVTSLEIRTPVDDLVNATASFVGVDEEAVSDFTVAFPSTDHYFRHYDVTIKMAANVAGLAAASAMSVKEFSISMVNNGRVNQNIGELNPGDVLGIMHEITGSLVLDYTDETYHDIYAGEEYRAMQITMKRTDVELDDVDDTINPEVTIVLPKVSFTNNEPDRPIDDIVSQGIEFMAHYDEDESKGIEVTIVNEIANYN